MSDPPSQSGSEERDVRVSVNRRTAWLFAAGVLLTGPAVLPGSAQERCAGVTVGRDGWTRVAAPEFYDPDEFAFGEGTIQSHAVVTGRPSTILVSDGSRVLRTTDRGCTWDRVFTGDSNLAVVTVSNTRRVVDIDTASYNTASKRVYLLVQEETVPLTVNDAQASSTPQVYVSDDDGDSFTPASNGLPLVGTPLRIRVADGPATVAYVAIADPLLGVESLYVTRNAGTSWTRTSGGTSILPNLDGSITDFAVDSGRPDQVWAWDDETLFRSTDSGATFRPVTEVTEPVSTMEFDFNGLGKLSDVRAYHVGQATADFAAAPNIRWSLEEAPGAVLSVARTPGGEVRALGTSREVFVTYPNLRTGMPIGPVGITPTGAVPEDLELGFDVKKQEPLLVGRTPAALLLRNPVKPPPPLPPLPKLPGIGRLDECVTDKLPGTSFVPSTREVVLRPGESRTVGYGLSIPPVPTDLDVNFMLDTTGSMSGVIAGLRKDIKQIVSEICDAGVPVQFGLADFREFEGPFGGGVTVGGGGNDPDQYPYLRRLPVSPVGPALREAIEGLDVGGGAADGSDAALEAMLQAVTGRGKKDATGQVLIEAGQGADFRARSLKVIVLAIDTTWREATPGYPGPSYDEVVAELRKRGVRVVGLAIGERSANGELLRTNKSDMQRLGRATRTLAGPEGSDCDDDGTVDVAPGEPLVCVLEQFGRGGVTLAPAMVGLLNSIEDRASVGIEVLADPAIVAAGGLLSREGVDVKKPNRLAFDSVFTCTQSQFGRTLPVTVNAVSRGRVLATTSLTVRCGVPARRVDPVLPQVVVPVAAAAIAPPPPPPPAPVPQPQPQPQTNPNVNPQINPQPNLQPNVGAVGQEQEQLEVALATVDITDDGDAQYAMSRVTDDDAAVQTASVLLGIGLTAGAAYGLSARRRTQPAPVYVRRDR